MMRIFVFTPVYRLEPETIAAVHALAWDGAICWRFQRDNPGTGGRENILHQYRQGRRAFLAGDYDAMLVVESDIIIPPDSLQKLARLKADLAYGVYVFRRSRPQVINIFERYQPAARNPGESLSLNPNKLKAALAAGVVKCSGAGLGCVLIQRRVLERIDFRLADTAHCDTYFNRDAFHAGFSQVADMSVVCGHKDESGAIYYPRFDYAR